MKYIQGFFIGGSIGAFASVLLIGSHISSGAGDIIIMGIGFVIGAFIGVGSVRDL